jgi:hypothetical protein
MKNESKVSVEIELSVDLYRTVLGLSNMYGRSIADVLMEWTRDELEEAGSLMDDAVCRGWHEFQNYGQARAFAERLKANQPKEAVFIEPFPGGGYYVDFLKSYDLCLVVTGRQGHKTQKPSEHAEVI